MYIRVCQGGHQGVSTKVNIDKSCGEVSLVVPLAARMTNGFDLSLSLSILFYKHKCQQQELQQKISESIPCNSALQSTEPICQGK